MQENLKNLESKSSELTEIDSKPLPATIAVSQTLEDFDNKPVVFSFESYNQNQCRIFRLDKKEAKHLTTELRKMSRVLTKHFKHQQTSGVACKAVHSSGNYAMLFNDIPQDVELLEVDYTKAGRIFGYIVKNVFNVVAVAKEHLK